MKIISGIVSYFRDRGKTWNTLTDEHAFPQYSVFASSKRIYEREVLKPGALRPGEKEAVNNPAERELREKVLFRNGTVVTGDARKEEVTIQPAGGNPIIIPKASLVIGANAFTIKTKHLEQTVDSAGNMTLTDRTAGYKSTYNKAWTYSTYTVYPQGNVSATIYNKKGYVGQYNGSETQEGYVRANNNLIAPFLQRKYIVAPPAEQVAK
jgi:hypothetical protein